METMKNAETPDTKDKVHWINETTCKYTKT